MSEPLGNKGNIVQIHIFGRFFLRIAKKLDYKPLMNIIAPIFRYNIFAWHI
jgi:hypothetical protein